MRLLGEILIDLGTCLGVLALVLIITAYLTGDRK